MAFECKDIPQDLVLSIIRHESGGRAGDIAKRKSKSAEIPTDSGGKKIVDRAMGLLQVIAPNVAAWNERKQPIITWEDMTGQDERSARLQIRIGCSIFASCVQRLHQFDPSNFPGKTPGTAPTDQLSLAVVAYLMGPGKPGGQRGLIPRLEALKAKKIRMNLKNLALTFPKWGWNEKEQRWINRPNQYGHSVWAAYTKNTGQPHPTQDKPRNGWIIPVGIGLIALGFLLSQQKGGLFGALKTAR